MRECTGYENYQNRVVTGCTNGLCRRINISERKQKHKRDMARSELKKQKVAEVKTLSL